MSYPQQHHAHRSVSITINLAAIKHNVVTARRLSGGVRGAAHDGERDGERSSEHTGARNGARVFATIKADAYGHGAVPVAQALSETGSEGYADGFAVVSIDEALQLRTAGISLPILVLQGPQSKDACAVMAHENLWPVIHDNEQYEWYQKLVERETLNAWLKVDSGMGRLGVSVDDANRILQKDHGINWMGLMTHFARADETDSAYTEQQLATFNEVDVKPGMLKSLANSAAVLAWPNTHKDWVRPGIMLYGCNPLNDSLPDGVKLLPAMTVEAPVISVKTLEAGAGVGYAQSWHCPEAMPVACVALGYRDGLPRVLDKHAVVSINGRECPIIGRVSMDSIAVDVRGVDDVRLGTMAQFWGESADIDKLAKAADTINYELLTSIRGIRHYTD